MNRFVSASDVGGPTDPPFNFASHDDRRPHELTELPSANYSSSYRVRINHGEIIADAARADLRIRRKKGRKVITLEVCKYTVDVVGILRTDKSNSATSKNNKKQRVNGY